MDCINGEYDENDEEKLEEMVQIIKDYTNLFNTVNSLRKIKPDRNKEDHRLKLKKLFENIIDIEIQVGPTKEEDTITDKDERPDWTSIGFQGLDPITDFRGGGLLSLEQLCFFTTQNREIIDKINERANHPTTVSHPHSVIFISSDSGLWASDNWHKYHSNASRCTTIWSAEKLLLSK